MARKAKKRNGEKIYTWMRKNKLTYVDIARELEYASHVPVWRTVHGEKNLRKVLRYLLDHGCPPRILSLPDDMEAAQ
ncbi:hypothetical protein [Desulfobulbus elongatus]|uniref:hypothetical protein n=1 Tax=Desulfobulbus elongatus TaxID=53332 RepID=UPI000488F680|nr:hypothetical protein [Desulfobulbus elongatus]